MTTDKKVEKIVKGLKEKGLGNAVVAGEAVNEPKERIPAVPND